MLRDKIIRIPEVAWAPVAAGFLILITGIIVQVLGYPLLFPSLGPTAYIVATSPKAREASFYNTLAGHFIGLGAGFLAVFLAGATKAPVVLVTHHMTFERTFASVLALALTLLGNILLKAKHPPAGATTMLVSLGAFSTWKDAFVVATGVIIIAVVGEGVRFLRAGGKGR